MHIHIYIYIYTCICLLIYLFDRAAALELVGVPVGRKADRVPEANRVLYIYIYICIYLCSCLFMYLFICIHIYLTNNSCSPSGKIFFSSINQGFS